MIGSMAARLPANLVQEAVRLALAEDLGLSGDITSRICIPGEQTARLAMVARKPGVVAGLALAAEAFCQLDPRLDIVFPVDDGTNLVTGQSVLDVTGNARAILAAERTALNFVGRLSGVATLTAEYVRRISGSGASIVCTRKTTPGLRAFEKHAVLCGGGRNHRFGLFDAILIKDNHVAVAGGVIPALRAAKRHGGHLVKVEIEVDTLDQLDEVLTEGTDVVLLDNMGPEQLREAVARIRRHRPGMLAEASGGVSLETVAAIAATGVDLISVGALTHSAPVLDLGLDFSIG
jgi:nicotinate-nucleotide pyrophosphorylase (carboxylating)